MQAPGIKVNTERWVAFEGNTDATSDPTLLGNLRYGDLNGVLSDVQIRVRPGVSPWATNSSNGTEDEAARDCSFLQWLENSKPHSSFGRKRPAPGECDFKSEFQPEPFDSLSGSSHPSAVNGIGVEYSIMGAVYATIPIVNDHLDIDRAQIVDRIKLVGAP